MRDYVFPGIVDLPIISSDSFETHWDEFGNFIWEWEVPYHLDPTLETSVRAAIEIYDQEDNWVGDFTTKLPPHVGYLIVPSDVLSRISELGGKKYKKQIQLRTNDGYNRSYSKEKPTKLFKKW